MAEASGQDTPVSAAALDAHLSFCVRTTYQTSFKPTWAAAKDPSNIDFRLPAAKGPMPLLAQHVAEGSEAGAQVVVASVTNGLTESPLKAGKFWHGFSWEQKLEREMVAGIRKWGAIIMHSPLSFDIGRRLRGEKMLGSLVLESLGHIFAGKGCWYFASAGGTHVEVHQVGSAGLCRTFPHGRRPGL